jgi:predicted dehydrogenase
MIDRREFLKRSAVVSGTMGASIAGGEKRDPIRCGLLGINHPHALDLLKVLTSSKEYDVVGVCEPDPGVRAKFERSIKAAGVRWLSRDELLGDETVKMVAIESDVPRLLELGRAAVEANKHIHLDKPAGMSLPEFSSLLDEGKRRNLIVQMGYMFRYNPGFDLIRRAVTERWLGDVYYIHGSMCTDYGPDKRASVASYPGGIMLVLGCHLIDMIVLLLGAPSKVTPFLRHDADADDSLMDNTLAVLEYAKAMAVVETAVMEPAPFPARRFKVCGTEGSITLEPLEPPTARISLRKPVDEFKAGTQEVRLKRVPRHVRDVDDLARCIRGESDVVYSKEHDLSVQTTLLKACGVEQ